MRMPGLFLPLVLLSFPVFPEGIAERSAFSTEERIIGEGDPLYGLVERQILIRGRDVDRVWEIRNIYTAFCSEQSGIKTQTDIYLGTDTPVRYDLEFTAAFTQLTGFYRRIDHVENGMIGKVELFPLDLPIVVLSAEEAEELTRFPLRRFSFFADTYVRPAAAANGSSIEVPLFRGSACGLYAGSSADLSEDEKTLLRRWGILHSAPGFGDLYVKKIFLTDNGRSIGLCVRDGAIFPDEGIPVFVRYFFVGSGPEGPVFAAAHVRPFDREQ